MPDYATITAGEVNITLDPVVYDETPTHTTIENRSVTGVIYRVKVKIRKAWKISFYCTKAEKEIIETLNSENTVTYTDGGEDYTCVMDVNSIVAICLVGGEEIFKIDVFLEETGATA